MPPVEAPDIKDEKVNTSVVKEKEKGPDGFDWNDLVFLAGRKWGLRHVTDVKVAEKQFTEGIDAGDAVSISTPMNFVPHEAFEETVMEKIKYLPPTVLARLVPEKYKEQTISGFENAIKDFIKESVGIDISRLPAEMTTKEVLDRLATSNLAFLVAKFGLAVAPYDKGNYYALGKCGKQRVSSEDMVFMFTIDDSQEDITSNLGLSEDEMKLPLSKKGFNKIGETCTGIIWRKFLGKVREEQSTKS